MSKSSKNFVKIGEAAKNLGVSIDTLRRWEKSGKIEVIRTLGGTRLYSISTLNQLTGIPAKYHRTPSKPQLSTVEDLISQISHPPAGMQEEEFIDKREVEPEELNVFTETEIPTSPIIASEAKQSSYKIATVTSWLRNDKSGHKIYALTAASGLLACFIFTILFLARINNFNFNGPLVSRISQALHLPEPKQETAKVEKAEDIRSLIPSGVANIVKTVHLNPDVLAAATTNYYLDINSDVVVEGSLAVGGSVNGLTLTPNTDGFTITGGSSASRKMTVVNGDVTLDQDVSTKSSPSFADLKLTTTSKQISMGGAGTLTWTPGGTQTITLPNASGNVLLDTATQTITNKTISGSSNTFSNIPNSALSNHKVTVSAGTNMSGGGDVDLGSSITLSLLGDISLTSIIASGNIKAATLTGTSYLTLSQTTAPTTTTNKLYNVSGALIWNGVDLSSGGALPAGTTGQTMYHNGTAWTATSNLFNNGTNVGIGITSPTSTLVVNNGSNAYPIFDALDNGTSVFQIADGGNITWTGTALTASSLATIDAAATLSIDSSTLTISNLATFTTAASLVMSSTTGLTLGGNSTIYGGTGASGTLTLAGTSNATAGNIILNGSGGNVGIGTTGPGSKLEVDISSNSTDVPITSTGAVSVTYKNTDTTVGNTIGHNFQNSNGQGIAQFGAIAGNRANNDGSLFFVTRNSTGMHEGLRIDNTGNVGIGTTSPSKLLHLSSTANTSIGLSDSDAAVSAKNLEIYTNNGTGYITNRSDAWAGGDDLIKMYLGAGDLSFVSDKMYIKNSGSVGIGTTGPRALLDIANSGVLSIQGGASPSWPSTGAGIEMTYDSNRNAGDIGAADGSGSGVAILQGYSRTASAYRDLWLMGSNVLISNDGTTPRVYITNGNVGIGTASPSYKVDITTNTASDRGINIANTAVTGTNHGIYSSVTGAATTNIGGYFQATGATTSRGLEVAALTSATSTGLTIGALSGTTADAGINIGAISGTGATGTGITVGNISTTGTTNYGLQLGTMTGGTTSNYQISTGVLTSATTTTNAQLNLGGVVTTGGTTNYGINVGALSGTGTTNYGVNVNTLTSVGTTNYGLNIGGATGAATTNYGLLIGAVSGATTNYGLYTTSGTTVLNATSGNVGIGTTSPTQLLTLGSTGAFAWDNGSGTADTMLVRDAANTLALRNGTNNQVIHVYASYTDSNNWSALTVSPSDPGHGIAYFGTNKAGTGANMALGFLIGGLQYWTMGTDQSLAPGYDLQGILGTSNKRISTLYMGGSSGSSINFSGTGLAQITTTTNQSLSLMPGSGGNVGIGTTAPSALLSVGSTSQFQVNSSGAIAASTGISNSGAYTQSGTSANTFTGTSTFSNATYSALFTGGNVGIGTTAPLTKLHVTGGANTELWVINTADANPRIILGEGTSAGQYGMMGWNAAGNFLRIEPNGANPLVLQSGIEGTGNVGIGTTTPSYLVDAIRASSTQTGLRIQNTTAGAAAFAGFVVANDQTNGSVDFFSSSFTTSGNAIANGLRLYSAGAGGISIASGHSSGKIQMFAGGASTPNMMIDTTGNVGIGTTVPTAKLHVAGQCVALGTRIRRRRKKKNGDWEEEDVPVEDIQPGNEVLSLNDKTGQWEWHTVEKTMDMGKQKVYELITESGKSIETTANHPYLVDNYQKDNLNWLQKDVFEQTEKIAREFYFTNLAGDSIYSSALEDKVSFTEEGWNHFVEKSRSINELITRFFALPRVTFVLVYAQKVVAYKKIVKKDMTIEYWELQQIIDHVLTRAMVCSINNGPKFFLTCVWLGTRDEEGIKANKKELSLSPRIEYSTHSDRRRRLITSQLLSKLTIPENSKNVKWTKVQNIKIGQKIATIDGWERVIAIKEKDRKQTYDLQIANTHNFVGNGIVAHNTYINSNTANALLVENNGTYNNIFSVNGSTGNVGIGTTSPTQALAVGSTSQFNVTPSGAVTAVGVNSGSGLLQGTGGLTVTGTGSINATGTSSTTIGNSTGTLTLHGATTLDNTFTVSGSNLTSLGGNLTVTGTAWTATPTISGLITATSGLTTPQTGNALTLSGAGANLAFSGAGLAQITTAASQHLALMPGGNVGIGTTGPASLLDLGNSAGRKLLIYGNSATAMNTQGFGVDLGGNTYSSSWWFADGSPSGSGRAEILSWNGTSYTARLVVKADGNVGIGTIAPSALLSVGSTSQFQVNSSGAIAASTGISNSGAYTQSGTSANTFTGTSTFSNATYSALFTGGNVGIGTTAPTAGALHVVGQCVAQGTRIRRRRKGKNGQWIEEDIPVEDIRSDDEVLSLDDKTGEFEWRKVEKTLDKGIQEVLALTTSSNKRILTTKEHPYLVLDKPLITQGTFEVDQSIRVEELGKATIIGIALGNLMFTAKLSQQDKKEILRNYQKRNKETLFAVHTFAQAVALTFKAAKIYPARIIIDTEYPGFERPIREIIEVYFPETNVIFEPIGKHSGAHLACYGVTISKKQVDVTLGYGEIEAKKKDRGHKALRTVTDQDKSLTIRNPHGLNLNRSYYTSHDLSRARWVKVSQIKVGQYVATTAGFEKITGIQNIKRIQTYDLQIEGTHNFVGNGIVAHNTYIKGLDQLNTSFALRTADSTGTDKFVVTNSGNVGIGTTGPGSKLEVDISSNSTDVPITSTGAVSVTYKNTDTTVGNTIGHNFQNSNGQGIAQFGAIAGNRANNDGSLFFVTRNSTGMHEGLRIDNTGNVGIGTTSPTGTLHISSDTATDLRLHEYTTGTSPAILTFVKGRGTAASPTTIAAGDYLGVIEFYGYDGTSNDYVGAIVAEATGFASNQITSALYFRTANEGGVGEVMRITGSGNVGIGTTGPGAKLHVYDANQYQAIIQNTGASNLGQLVLRNTAGGDQAIHFGGGASWWNIGQDISDSGKFKFSTDSGGDVGVGTKVTIDSSGSVGIGTTGPAQALDVTGKIRYTSEDTDASNNYVCYNTTNKTLSDCTSLRKYKDDIVSLNLGLETVMQLNPVQYRVKDSGEITLGFLAEEVEAVNPLLATYKDGDLAGVKMPQMTALLTKALQEQQLQISSQSAELSFQKTALQAANLVSQTDSLNNGWIDNLGNNILQNSSFVNELNNLSVELPGVEPGGLGLSIQPSEPASPSSITLSQLLTNLVNTQASQSAQITALTDALNQQRITLSGDSLTEFSANAQRPDLSIQILPQNTNNVKYVDLTGIEPANPDSSDLDVHQHQAHTTTFSAKMDEEANYFDAAAKIIEINSKLQAQESTISAFITTAVTQINALSASVSSMSAQLADLQTEVATNSASTSTTSGVDLNLTPPEVLISTGSATLANLEVSSDATVSGRLVSYNLSVQNTFKSLGQAFLGNTTVAGDLIVDGTLSVSNNSINAIGYPSSDSEKFSPDGSNNNSGILYLQNSPLTQVVDFFNGQAVIDKKGKLSVQKLELSGKVLGTAVIPAKTLEIPVNTIEIKDNSKIFLTPLSPLAGSSLIVSRQEVGSGFVVALEKALDYEVKFNWLIIDQSN